MRNYYVIQVREVIRGRRWQRPKGKAREVTVSPLVRAFWEETGVEPAASCTRLCWELPPRGVFRKRERGAISYAITFLDDMAVHVPTLDAWDQFVWPPSAAVPRTATQVEQYGYCHGNAINLGVVMPAMEFRVTDEEGAYLCAVCTIPPGTRRSGSPPAGSPMILAGRRREWQSHW